METISYDWLAYGFIFISGTIAGVLLTLWLQPGLKKSRKLAQKLEQAEQQQDDYQLQVSTHFSETTELFSDLTEHYQKIYQHFSKSAQTLGANEVMDNLTSNRFASAPDFRNALGDQQKNALLTNGAINNDKTNKPKSTSKSSDAHLSFEPDLGSEPNLGSEPDLEKINSSGPRDYALVSDKHKQGGTLAEDFGLTKKRDSCLDEEK